MAMKITKVSISNFLKLRDVEFNPEKVNVIVGKNKQGKTSILRALQAAFSGNIDESVISQGETKAEIILELDEYRIERTVTAKGNYLDVANKDGWKVPAPQKFLNGLIGQFSFNPIEFFNLKSADKKKYLLQAIDIRLTPEKLTEMLGEKVDMNLDRHGLEVISELHKHYYGKRTLLNAEVSKKEKTVSELSAQIPEGFDPSVVNEEKVKELRSAITKNEVAKRDKQALEDRGNALKKEIEILETQLANKKELIIAVGQDYQAIKIQDTALLEKELADLESKRETVHTVKQVEALKSELVTEQAEQERVNGLVQRLSKDIPAQLIQEANLPVEGLQVGAENVMLNGVDIENLSSSEQLSFALKVVRILNDKFQIICIDGVEILDKETFEWFIGEIEKDDYQYFITRVDGDKGWLVDNGEVSKK